MREKICEGLPELTWKGNNMQPIQHWRQKTGAILVLCFLIIIGISACTTNSTDQQCEGVVNVNSCASNDTTNNIQATAQAQNSAQANLDATATVQAGTQANLDATATAVTTKQSKDANIISVGHIIIPGALLMSIFALIMGIFAWTFSARGADDKASASTAITVIAVTISIVLLIIMIIIALRY